MTEDTTASEAAETATRKAAELTAPLADAADTVSRTAAENIGLTLVGGLVVGLAIGALLPLSRRRKPARQTLRSVATTLAATVSELGQTLAAQAKDRAETAIEDGQEKLGSASRTIGKSIHEHTDGLAESFSKQAKKLVDDAADQLNDSGKAIARRVVKLVEKARN